MLTDAFILNAASGLNLLCVIIELSFQTFVSSELCVGVSSVSAGIPR